MAAASVCEALSDTAWPQQGEELAYLDLQVYGANSHRVAKMFAEILQMNGDFTHLTDKSSWQRVGCVSAGGSITMAGGGSWGEGSDTIFSADRVAHHIL